MAAAVAPSGEQHEIRGGGYTAVVTQSGAALRELTYDGRPVVDPFAADAMAPGGHGQLLMPWPNRIRDGRYAVDGRALQLPLTEPARHNASHGLVRWVCWTPVETTASAVTLGYRLMAQTGYPWTLDCTVRYQVSAAGLTVTQGAVNRSAAAAPYAQGAHPYLVAGPATGPATGLATGAAPVDGWELTVPAGTRLLADADRKLPAGSEPVAGTAFDFRVGRAVGDTVLDHAFTDLDRDAEGRATVTVRDPATGIGSALWVDDHHPWVMVYTADDQPPAAARHAVAVEPMTAPADAFNSGDSLLWLDPGQAFSATWGILALT